MARGPGPIGPYLGPYFPFVGCPNLLLGLLVCVILACGGPGQVPIDYEFLKYTLECSSSGEEPPSSAEWSRIKRYSLFGAKRGDSGKSLSGEAWNSLLVGVVSPATAKLAGLFKVFESLRSKPVA